MNKAKRIIELAERGMGKPRTDAERKARHKAKFGTDKLPPRGTGRKMGHGGGMKEEAKKVEVQVKDKRGNEMKAEVCNPNDLFGMEDGPFWKHTYLIQLSSSNYIVNADHDQSAIDELIDYLVEFAPGYILSPEEEEEAEEDGSIEDYVQGGNASNYINEPIMKDQMDEIDPKSIRRL